MPSVLLVNGMSSIVTTIATPISASTAVSHTSGPHPRSDQRNRRPRSVRAVAGPPAAHGVQAPPHRWPVADENGDGGVDDDRPVEADQRVDQEAGGDERDRQHGHGADGHPQREHGVRLRDRRREGDRRRVMGPHAAVEVAPDRPAVRVGIPPGLRSCRWWQRPRGCLRRVRHGGSVPPRLREAGVPCDDGRVQSGSLWAATMPPERRVTTSPLDGDTDADVAIIGGGYTGLWTALYLAEADPTLRVVVLESEHVGHGASGRNGGWCSALLSTGLTALAGRHGRDAAIAMKRAMIATVDEIGSCARRRGTTPATARAARSHSPAHRRRNCASPPPSRRLARSTSAPTTWRGWVPTRSATIARPPPRARRRVHAALRRGAPVAAGPRRRRRGAAPWCAHPRPDGCAGHRTAPGHHRTRRRARRRGRAGDRGVHRRPPRAPPRRHPALLADDRFRAVDRAAVGPHRARRASHVQRRPQHDHLRPAHGRRAHRLRRSRRAVPLRVADRAGLRSPRAGALDARRVGRRPVPRAPRRRLPVPLGRPARGAA